MPFASEERESAGPEKLVLRLLTRLKGQAIWDALLIALPPLLAAIYVVGFLYRTAWLHPAMLLAMAMIAVAVATLSVYLRCRSRVPSLPAVARLVDQRAGTKDHFLTLATLEPSTTAAKLAARLRRDAVRFLPRVDLKRDFGYRIKRSFYGSLLVSLVTIALFQLLLPLAYSTLRSEGGGRRLGEIAAQMAQRPGLAELARELQRLADKIEDPQASPQDRQAPVQEARKKVEERRKQEKDQENRNLLGEAASALQNIQEQSDAGQKQQQEKGGGGIKSQLPQDGRGEGKSKPDGGGDGSGDQTAEINQDMKQGKSAPNDLSEQGQEKNPQSPGDGKNSKRDPNKPGQDQATKKSGQRGADDKGGRGKSSEEIPQGAPPQERFYKAGGQGPGGLKGAGYVTVQLPEEVAAEAKGQRSGTKDGKGNKVGASVPISNTPLPAHVPDAPTEKQQMPLEYRGMIR